MKKPVTITRWITMLLLAVWLGLLALCLFISAYTGAVMRAQAAKANEDLLSVYLEKIDANVSGISRFLSQFAGSNYNVSVMARTADETEHYLSMQDVMRQLRSTSFLYNDFNGIFVYSKNKTVGNRFLCQLRDGTSLTQQEDIRAYVEERADNVELNGGWRLIDCDGRAYLFSAVRTGDTYCGAWLSPKAAIEPLMQLNLGQNGAVLIQDLNGKILADTSGSIVIEKPLAHKNSGKIIDIGSEKYLQISRLAKSLPAELTVLIPESFFTDKVRFTQTVIIFVFAAMLLILAMLWFKINKAIAQPVKMLTEVMHRVGRGDLNAQASEMGRFAEFDTIASSFNSMTGQIQELQKDVYERILNEQKTRLQYLQVQIRPHFFLNALNVIYSFSLTKQNKLIEELTLCLSRYFRYIFNCELSYVPLSAELEHITNYMEILRLRSRGEFEYFSEFDEILLEAQIPPLTIQPFIENSIKYGCNVEGVSEIYLTAECRQSGGEQKLCITIRDNGPGYPDKILDNWQKNKPLGFDITQKIGLVNVRQRLELTYGTSAHIDIKNVPEGGACSEIIMPLIWREEAADNDNTAG